MSTDKNDPFSVPALHPVRLLRNVEQQVTMCAGSNTVFFRDASGKVYASRPVDLSRSLRVNDTDRRAWAKLAGKTITEVRAMVAKHRQEVDERHVERVISGARLTLELNGYRVTKIRKPKGA